MALIMPPPINSTSVSCSSDAFAFAAIETALSPTAIEKSMAFSLTLSDPAAEVSNEQVERTVKKVLGNLKFKLGIEIR